MANIKVLFWFDVEDFITPESEEALLGLIRLCDERNIPGIFKLVGEKARSLKEHGRTDILEGLSRHEVGYHTNDHSIHPTISEYLEPKGFKDGAEEFDRREWQGLVDVEDITGQPVRCYGQPGGSWAPQQFPALKKWGVPVYLDNHPQVTLNDQPYWYGGILNFMELTGFMRMELEGGGLERAIKEFDEVYEKLSSENVGFVSIVYHPCEFATTEFWDGCNFAYGKNPPREEWVPAPLRPEGEMEHYLQMLGQFLDYTLSKPGVEYITSTEALELECSDQGELSSEKVVELARGIGSDLNYKVNGRVTLSASDLHSLFRSYVRGEPLQPELIYGPERDEESDEVSSVTFGDLKQALDEPYWDVYGYKQLPDYFTIGGKRLNPVDVTCTLAKAIADGKNRDEDVVAVVKGSLRPMQHAKDKDFWGDGWVIFPRDFYVPNLVKMSKLQTWTLKPAVF